MNLIENIASLPVKPDPRETRTKQELLEIALINANYVEEVQEALTSEDTEPELAEQIATKYVHLLSEKLCDTTTYAEAAAMASYDEDNPSIYAGAMMTAWMSKNDLRMDELTEEIMTQLMEEYF